MQIICIIRGWIAHFEARLTRIDSVPDARTFRFHRTTTQWTIVHFARLIVPQVRVQPKGMLNFFRQLFHRTILFVHVELISGRIG